MGGSNASLLPNEECHGRRRDADEKILGCHYFPERAERECIGCGCHHEQPDPRNMEVILTEADRMFSAYREHGHVD